MFKNLYVTVDKLYKRVSTYKLKLDLSKRTEDKKKEETETRKLM